MEHPQRDVDDRHTGRESRGAQQSPSRLRIGVPQVGRLPVHELLLVLLDRRLRFLVVDRARVAGIALDPARVPEDLQRALDVLLEVLRRTGLGLLELLRRLVFFLRLVPFSRTAALFLPPLLPPPLPPPRTRRVVFPPLS